MATDAGSGALALLTSKAYINLIRLKAKPIKTKAHQNNPENYQSTYLIRILISLEPSRLWELCEQQNLATDSQDQRFSSPSTFVIPCSIFDIRYSKTLP